MIAVIRNRKPSEFPSPQGAKRNKLFAEIYEAADRLRAEDSLRCVQVSLGKVSGAQAQKKVHVVFNKVQGWIIRTTVRDGWLWILKEKSGRAAER